MHELEDLRGKIAVVTGSSSGIGRAVALRLAAAGVDVLVHARQNRQGADDVAARIQQYEVQSTVVMADLASPGERDRFMVDAWNWRGAIDILVNNAGADTLTGEAAKWSFEQKLGSPVASRCLGDGASHAGDRRANEKSRHRRHR